MNLLIHLNHLFSMDCIFLYFAYSNWFVSALFSWKRIVLSIWCKVKFLLRLPMVFWDIKKFKNVCSWICHSLLLWLWGFMPKFRNTFLTFRLLKYPPFFSFIVSLVLFYSFKFWPIWNFCGCVVWGRDPTFSQVVMRAFFNLLSSVFWAAFD